MAFVNEEPLASILSQDISQLVDETHKATAA